MWRSVTMLLLCIAGCLCGCKSESGQDSQALVPTQGQFVCVVMDLASRSASNTPFAVSLDELRLGVPRHWVAVPTAVPSDASWVVYGEIVRRDSESYEVDVFLSDGGKDVSTTRVLRNVGRRAITVLLPNQDQPRVAVLLIIVGTPGT